MDKITQFRDKAVAVLTSVVLIATAVSQAGAEILEAVAGWDGQLVNLIGLAVAVIAVIRRVTPVAKDERGLT